MRKYIDIEVKEIGEIEVTKVEIEEKEAAQPTRFNDKYVGVKTIKPDTGTYLYAYPGDEKSAILRIPGKAKVTCNGMFTPVAFLPWLYVEYEGRHGYIDSLIVA